MHRCRIGRASGDSESVTCFGEASLTQGGCDGSSARYTTAKLSEEGPPTFIAPVVGAPPSIVVPGTLRSEEGGVTRTGRHASGVPV